MCSFKELATLLSRCGTVSRPSRSYDRKVSKSPGRNRETAPQQSLPFLQHKAEHWVATACICLPFSGGRANLCGSAAKPPAFALDTASTLVLPHGDVAQLALKFLIAPETSFVEFIGFDGSPDRASRLVGVLAIVEPAQCGELLDILKPSAAGRIHRPITAARAYPAYR